MGSTCGQFCNVVCRSQRCTLYQCSITVLRPFLELLCISRLVKTLCVRMGSETIFWILIAISHIPIVSIPILFFQLRNRELPAFISPLLLALNSAALVVTVYSEIARALWVDYIGLWYDLLAIRILLMFVLQSLFLIIVWLYTGFLKTRAQVKMMQTPSGTTKSMGSSINTWNFFLSQKFAVLWSLLMMSFCSIITLLSVNSSRFGLSLMNTAISSSENSTYYNSVPAWGYAAMSPCIFPLVGIFAVHAKLWNVEDTFRIKQVLRIYMVEITMGILLHPVSLRLGGSNFNHGIPSVVLILVCDVVLGTVMIRLLYDITQAKHGPWKLFRKLFLRKADYQSTTGLSKTEEHFAHFEDFLKTDAGFADFRKHLETEFAVENLLFWKEAQDFKKRAEAEGRITPEISKDACAIYSKYLSSSAPLELNLPFDLLKRYRTDLFRKNKQGQESEKICETIFDEAAHQTLRLMQYSSMDRYLRTQPKSWKAYLDGLNEPRLSGSLTIKMRLPGWTSHSKAEKGDDGTVTPKRFRSLHRSGSVLFKISDFKADDAGSATPMGQSTMRPQATQEAPGEAGQI